MPLEAKALSELIEQYDSGMRVHSFSKAADVFEYISSGGIADICFLDILMPETSGIDLAEKLRAFGYCNEIVFLTSSNHYAAESYAVDAFSYLLKPPSLESVKDIFSRLRDKDKSKEKGFLVRSKEGARFVRFCDISYFEAYQRKTLIRLVDKQEVLSNKIFSETSSILLSEPNFIQCHRSYIVNMEQIQKVLLQDIIMQDGTMIPLSKNFAEAKKKYFDWLLNN